MLLRYISLQFILLFFYSVAIGQNLIVNPSAETAPVGNGWTQVSGNWTRGQETVKSGATNPQAVVDGSYHFFCDDGVNTVDEIYQDIDVSSNAVYIDAGRYEYSFSGWVRDWDGSDMSQLIVEYRDASSSVLGSYSTGFQGLTSWTEFTDTRTAPANTRTIRIRIQSQFNNGTDNDGYADALSLTARLLPPSGHTGPGGVGSVDGTSDLVLWLDANTVSASNGSTQTSWSDQSGYGYDMNAGNGAVFYTSVQNAYPAFSFNGSSHYFQRAYTADLNPSTFTIFAADNVTSSGNYKAVISNRDDPSGSATAGFILYSQPTNNNWAFWTGRSSGGWEVTSGGTSTAGNWAGQTIEYQNSSNGKKMHINGSLDAENTHSLTTNPSNPIRIGAGKNEDSSPDYYYQGYIGEIIMYKVVLNSAQRIIVQNYLAAKYNYSLASNKVYYQADGGQGNYDHEVAGIGRVDASNIHNDAQGTGIVRIDNPSGLGNNEFLIWGHDNGDLNATEATDVPSSVSQRLDRVWRVSEVNISGTAVDVGNIDISWDLVSLGTVTASDLRLLIDTDNDGNFADETPISGATSVGGGFYKFSGVSAIANNLRFTLGTINNVQTPLPIELISFDAKLTDNNKVDLLWQTATETNNDYFTIERSKDGQDWESVAKVIGAGNSNELRNYSYKDIAPLNGINYYRLKQTDYDGTYTYSMVRKLQIIAPKQLHFYPNPVKSIITIEGFIDDKTPIIIYNMQGQNVSKQLKKVQNQGDKIVLDLSYLPAGIYFIQSSSQAIKVFKQ